MIVVFRIKLCLVFLLLTAGILRAQESAWADVEEKISAGMHHTILNQFDAAEQTFLEIIDSLPEHPGGYFYLGAAIQARMLDEESYRRLPEFESLMVKTTELAQQLQKREPQNVLAWFFEGSAYLYRSFMASKQKEYWRAYRSAVSGVKLLEKAIAADSTFYDAYLGVGSFRFWKSEKAGMLTWLPFISDERKEGIKMVRMAIDKGRFVSLVARDQLAWILVAAGQQDEALNLAQANHRDFPDSRFFLWTLAEVTFRAGDLDTAEGLFLQLLQEVRSIEGNNHYSEIGILLKLAEISRDHGNYVLCNARVNDILVLELAEHVRERVSEKLQRAINLKVLCAGELAEVGK